MRVASFGQYGVDYVPATQDLIRLREIVKDPETLRRVLLASKRTGTIVIDTKSDFERPTHSAILASDLTIIVVKDNASLIEASRTFDLLEKAGRPRESAKILLSLVDMRVKYSGEEQTDVLAHLIGQIRKEGFPLFETFVSRSPKVESLYTNPTGRAIAILQGARTSVVHRQMIQLTQEVAAHLDALPRISQMAGEVAMTAVDRATIATPASAPAPAPSAPQRDHALRRPEPAPRKGSPFWTGLKFGNRK